MLWVTAKRCGCGLVYKSEADWRKLTFAFLHFDGVETVESRHCSCESTISVHISHGNTVAARRKELGLTGPFNDTTAKSGTV